MRTDTRTTLIVSSIAAAAMVVGLVVGLEVGQGSAVSTIATASPTELAAANPVPILQRMGVPLAPGVAVGQVDIYGDRYASGQFADGEQVTVYTYTTQQAENAAVARFGPPTDTNKLLVGDLFTVLVTGVDTADGISFPQSLAVLSQETGAKAVTG